jgi:maltokinase
VRDLLREGDLYAEEVGGDFAGESYRLGVATAEVHAALRETLPTDSWDGAELRSRADLLEGRLQAALESAPALVPFADRVMRVYEELASLPDPVPVQRVHGDLHLAQTMRVTSGWKILDFEGEPARPVEERRALDSHLRDVAGMLRSFDYAARYPLGDTTPDPQAVYRAAEWAGRNREAFCDGYAHAAGADPREQDVLLRAYEADKVVYEVVYESRMRPHWVSIPMSALERLAG